MDYSQLHDAQINMMVCKALGLELSGYTRILMQDDATILLSDNETLVDYCNNPADAWPIITSNGISVIKDNGLYLWCATSSAYWVDGVEWQLDCDVMHSNPLRAAMIVFLMMQDKANANP
jgi:hypothetical protein